MTGMMGLEPLKDDDIEIVAEGRTVKFSGVISMRSPSETITPFLRKVHDAAMASGLDVLDIDIRDLRFMNSSSIRALVDWVEWNRTAPEGRRYVLNFLSSAQVTWQGTTLSVLRALDEAHVQVSTG